MYITSVKSSQAIKNTKFRLSQNTDVKDNITKIHRKFLLSKVDKN